MKKTGSLEAHTNKIKPKKTLEYRINLCSIIYYNKTYFCNTTYKSKITY